MQQRNSKKNPRTKKLFPVIAAAMIVCTPVSGFAQISFDTKAEDNSSRLTTERAELNYSQRHSQFKSAKNLYADGVKIKRDLSILKNFQEKQKQSDDEIPSDDLYQGLWAGQHVSIYGGLKGVPDTFDVDLSNFSMPVPGKINSPFGPRHHRMHYGIDLHVQRGDTIHAAFDGKVRVRQFDKRGYGNYVVLRHANGLETLYGHCSKILVSVNQIVKSGDPIALGGSTGHSTGPHLHFELRYVGKPFNPAKVIDFTNKVCHWNHYVITPSTFDYASHMVGRYYFNSRTSKNIHNKYASSKFKIYRIKKGDTLMGIARKTGITVKQLCQMNHITPSTILALGRVLEV